MASCVNLIEGGVPVITGGKGEELSSSSTRVLSGLLAKAEGAVGSSMVEDDDKLKDFSDFDKLDEYVMEHLFSYLTVSELAKCRLVSWLWNQTSLRVLSRKGYYLNLNWRSHWQRECAICPSKQDPSHLGEYCKLIHVIKSSTQFPWTKFSVDGELAAIQERQTNLHKLFQTIGQIATNLNIYDLVSGLFSGDTIGYPVLTTLSLHFKDRWGWPTSCEMTVRFALDIVANAPKLRTLYLSGSRRMDCFMKIFESDNGRRIKRLFICSGIENGHLVKLTKLGLKLEYLSLDFVAVPFERLEIGEEEVVNFLECQKGSLKELHFGQAPTTDENVRMSVRFPRMERLKVLGIALRCQYLNVNYEKQFPVLKKLEFWLDDPKLNTFKSFFNSKMKPVDTVVELVFSVEMNDPEIIMHAGRQFPNLRKLSLHANAGLLDSVGRSMPSLEELRLLCEGDEDMDAILSGLSTKACKKMKDLAIRPLGILEKIWQPVRCLQGLRKLALVKDRESGYKISNFACRFALLKLERLQILEFVGGYYSYITEETFTVLKNKVTVLMS